VMPQFPNCPGCIVQIIGAYQAHFGGTSGSQAVGCLYNGIPAECPNPQTGTGMFSFTAPTTPGVYHLRYATDPGFSCPSGSFIDLARTRTLGVFRVQSSP
jgi:hypothetical protein